MGEADSKKSLSPVNVTLLVNYLKEEKEKRQRGNK